MDLISACSRQFPQIRCIVPSVAHAVEYFPAGQMMMRAKVKPRADHIKDYTSGRMYFCSFIIINIRDQWACERPKEWEIVCFLRSWLCKKRFFLSGIDLTHMFRDHAHKKFTQFSHVSDNTGWWNFFLWFCCCCSSVLQFKSDRILTEDSQQTHKIIRCLVYKI